MFWINEDGKKEVAIFDCGPEDQPKFLMFRRLPERYLRESLNRLSVVRVSEVHLWGDEIPDPLLEDFYLGKPAVPFSAPNQVISAGNSETT